MTNREHEFLNLGIEYAEGMERAKEITLPHGHKIFKTTGEHGDVWVVQPWGETHWLRFDDLLDAVKCGTRPETIRPIEYAGRPQRNPPDVEVRKPFTVHVVYDWENKCDAWGVNCIGKPNQIGVPMPPNMCLLVTFQTQEEAQSLADSLNEAFANHFDV